MSGVDWLLAEQEQISTATRLRFVDLDGLPQDKTMGPLNMRPVTDVRRRARKMIPPIRKGREQAQQKTTRFIGNYLKPLQPPCEDSGDYTRAISIEGNDSRYIRLDTPKGDSLFASYDTFDIMKAKYLIVASLD